MFITADRQNEILYRARNRTVTAILNLSASGADEGAAPEQFGLIYEDRKPVESLRGGQMVSQTAQLWQMDDTCEPLAERDPKLLANVLAAVKMRTNSLTSGELSVLHANRKAVPFNCEDLVDKATGIPSRLSLTFLGAGKSPEAEIDALPFPKLKHFLLATFERVRAIGGTLHSVDVAHKPSMTAFDFYEIGLKTQMPGQKFTYGHVMLARATTLLRDIGMPYVEPRRPSGPSSKPH